MGNLLGLAVELITIVGGIYIILYFGGYRTPKAGDEESLKRFYALKAKHGKKLVALGVVVTLIGLFNLVRFFI